MKIIWGGKLEGNRKRHSENRSMRRGITKEMIKSVITEPDRTEIQSMDCKRYYKQITEKDVCIVAVDEGNEQFTIITCFEVSR
jgi:hypothetical protein